MPPVFRSQMVDILPMLLTLVAAITGVYFYGTQVQVLALVLGAIAGGLVDQDHRLTGRLTNLVFMLLAFTFSSLMVEWGLNLGYAFALIMAGLTFGFTMLGAAGSRYRTVAFGTLAVATYTSLTQHAGQHWGENSLLILAGALLYSLNSLIVYAIFPYRPLRKQLHSALLALAKYISLKARFYDPDEAENLESLSLSFALQNAEVTARFGDVQRVLNYRLTSHAPRRIALEMTQLYLVMQDVHERISSVHIDYQSLALHWRRTDFPFRLVKLVEQQSQFCRTVAEQVWSGATLTPAALRLQAYETQTLEAWQWHNGSRQGQERTAQLPGLPRLIENLTEIDRQLISLSQPLDLSTSPTLATQENESLGAALRTLRHNLGVHSPVFRHAVRLTVVVTLSCLVALAFKLTLGFWIMLTALFVCQPSYTATRGKIIQRVLGTVLGTLVGSIIPSLIPSYEGKLLIIGLSTALFFWFRSARYSSSTFFITVEALTALSLAGLPVQEALLPRIADTLLGCLLAWLAVNFIWPDWAWLDIRRSAAQALDAASAYLEAIGRELPRDWRDEESQATRRQVYAAAAELGQQTKEMQASGGQYGLRTKQGEQLLALTYGLLGVLASLDAYRQKTQRTLSEQTAALLRDTAELTRTLPELSPSEFTQRQSRLTEQIGALDTDPLVRQQLLSLLQLLTPFQATIKTLDT